MKKIGDLTAETLRRNVALIDQKHGQMNEFFKKQSKREVFIKHIRGPVVFWLQVISTVGQSDPRSLPSTGNHT